MTENEFDRTARTWLDDGPTRMSDRAVLSTLEEIHTTRQRRTWWPAWRATPVNIFPRVASAAILVIAVGLLAVTVVPRLPNGSSVGGPSPTAAQSLDISELTTTFVSPTNGFSFKFFDRGGLEPAREPWDPVNQPVLDDSGALYIDPFDYVDTGFGAAFMGASKAIPDGVSIDAWVDAAVVKYLPFSCSVPRSQQAEISIDGQSGRWCPDKVLATVVFDGRLYFFMVIHNPDVDGRAIFDTFAATIDLRPEEAAEVR
jgi:hypothetical protein